MDTRKELRKFDIDNLNMLEKQSFENFSKTMSKREALQIIINTVEEDFSQLSEELEKIAIQQDNNDRGFKVLPNNKYGCGFKQEDNRVIGVHIEPNGRFGHEEEVFEVLEENYAKGKESKDFVEDMIQLLGKEVIKLYPMGIIKAKS